MPIKIQSGLPARAILESENVFIMDEDRAQSQDIRPLEILILNLMPLKEDTETQLLRALSNTPLQVECTYMTMSTHESTHTSASHLNKFYVTFPEKAPACHNSAKLKSEVQTFPNPVHDFFACLPVFKTLFFFRKPLCCIFAKFQIFTKHGMIIRHI